MLTVIVENEGNDFGLFYESLDDVSVLVDDVGWIFTLDAQDVHLLEDVDEVGRHILQLLNSAFCSVIVLLHHFICLLDDVIQHLELSYEIDSSHISVSLVPFLTGRCAEPRVFHCLRTVSLIFNCLSTINRFLYLIWNIVNLIWFKKIAFQFDSIRLKMFREFIIPRIERWHGFKKAVLLHPVHSILL